VSPLDKKISPDGLWELFVGRDSSGGLSPEQMVVVIRRRGVFTRFRPGSEILEWETTNNRMKEVEIDWTAENVIRVLVPEQAKLITVASRYADAPIEVVRVRFEQDRPK
jgi:hypothetical protein